MCDNIYASYIAFVSNVRVPFFFQVGEVKEIKMEGRILQLRTLSIKPLVFGKSFIIFFFSDLTYLHICVAENISGEPLTLLGTFYIASDKTGYPHNCRDCISKQK